MTERIEGLVLRQLYISELEGADERGWVSKYTLVDQLGTLLVTGDIVTDTLAELARVEFVVSHHDNADYWRLHPALRLHLNQWGTCVLETLTSDPTWFTLSRLLVVMYIRLHMEVSVVLLPTILEHIKRAEGNIIEFRPYSAAVRLSVEGWLKQCRTQAHSS